MDNANFTERESLEVITRMLRQTKQNIAGKDNGDFLLFGWATVIISIAVYFLTTFTGNGFYGMLYLLLAVISVYREIRKKSHRPELVTFLDKSIEAIWQVMGIMFLLSYLIILGISFFREITSVTYAVLMPLSLLYAGLGVSITGILIRNSVLKYSPVVAFIMAIYMFVGFINDWTFLTWWYLLFGAAFLIMMVIPGYVMRSQDQK